MKTTPPSLEEIAHEAAHLSTLKTCRKFTPEDRTAMQAQYRVLKFTIDRPGCLKTEDEIHADGWNDHQQMKALDACKWLLGENTTKPSADWLTLLK